MGFLEKFNSAKNAERIYFWTRFLVYALAFLAAIYFAFILLFPTGYFEFSFSNPSSTKNTVGYPRLQNQIMPEKGAIGSGEKFSFEASATGNFSEAEVYLTLDKKSAAIVNGKVEVKKSYQAFLYPEGYPFGFQDGTLLKNSGNYFIISDGKLCPFSTWKIASAMGWREDSFWEASNEDLSYNPVGKTIEDSREYPDDSLFKVRDDYYILKNKELKKFVSALAFSSRYNLSQVVYKENDFFAQYPKSSELVGFSDGSLISYGDAVFIVSGKMIYPVGDASIFASLGYSWDDVIRVGADELAIYEKAKMLDWKAVHPDGTIFVTKDQSSYYIIKDKQKHSLPSPLVVKSWARKSPILASESSLLNSASCGLGKKVFSFENVFFCKIPIESLEDELGKDYEFQFVSEGEIKIKTLNIELKKIINLSNFRSTLGDILGRVKRNYVGEN